MMNKRVVGIYNSEEAVILEIDKLKALGHDEHSIFVLAKDHNRAYAIVEETGVQVENVSEQGDPEPQGKGVLSRMFYALDYDTQHSGVAAVLKSAGITEDEVGSYVRKLEQGDLVILANAEAPRQPYSDEYDAGFSNEEQSMHYYESGLIEGNTSEATPFNHHASLLNEQNNESYEEQIQDNHLKIHTDVSHVDSQAVGQKDIYVEHIYFDSATPPLVTNDEELIRVPIVEERVKVINEKVITGEIVVRRRTLK